VGVNIRHKNRYQFLRCGFGGFDIDFDARSVVSASDAGEICEKFKGLVAIHAAALDWNE
jgi:hypothetical protein